MTEKSNLSRMYIRPGFLLRRAHQISAALFEAECSEYNLTPAQHGVLTVLSAHTGIDQSTLARSLGFDKVTMLRVLRVLESRGLVIKAPAPNNRRNMAIRLSAAGRKLLRAVEPATEKAYKRLLSPLDRLQQKQFIALLQQLATGLEDQARAPLVKPQ